MKISKVELFIFKDVKKFANIAQLVDRDAFLIDINKTRLKILKQSGLKLPLFPWKPSLYLHELFKLSKKDKKIIEKKIKKAEKAFYKAIYKETGLKEAKKHFENACRLNPKENLNLDVIKLRNKYKQATFMDKVITKAIIYNEVHEEDVAYCHIQLTSSYPTFPFLLNEPEEISIAVTPFTDQKQVVKILNEELPAFLRKYTLKDKLGQYFSVNEKAKRNIIRDREWYWIKKETGKNYKEISTLNELCPDLRKKSKIEGKTIKKHNIDEEGNCPWCNSGMNYNDVGHAIRDYREWIKQYETGINS